MNEPTPSRQTRADSEELNRLEAMLKTRGERRLEKGDGRIFVWLREEKGSGDWFWWVCERIDPPHAHYRVLRSYRHTGQDAEQVLAAWLEERREL